MKSTQSDSAGLPDGIRQLDSENQLSSRRGVLFGILGLVLLAALVWGARLWMYSRSHTSTDDAAIDGRIVPVVSKVSGYLLSVNAEDNRHVAEGEVLAQIDTAELRVRLAQAEAEVAAARAFGGSGVSGQAEAQVAAAAGNRSALEAQAAAAAAYAARANSDLRRMQELASKQIISVQQLDAARAAAASANASLEAARRQASAAAGSLVGAEAGTRLASARYKAALAARDNAALQLSYARITSPVRGIVSRVAVTAGQLVQAAQPILTIVPDSGAWVTANFKETQLAKIRVGQPVEMDVDAYDGCVAQGKVDSFGAATGSRFALLPPDNATGNFTKVVQRVAVRIAITRGCGDTRPLRPGMSVSVHIKTS